MSKLIILAEDDKFINRAYHDGLKRAGFEVESANDGEELLKMLETKKPDLILLDLIMPIKNGFETLEEIKNNPKYKNIPVIVVSNLGQESDVSKTMKLGAVDYLIKSDYSLKEMIDKVKSHLE
ncbi:MAG: response regulator [Patescibacteria group bacterium]|nr:response regulator [Patescibacteria group bacterium]